MTPSVSETDHLNGEPVPGVHRFAPVAILLVAALAVVLAPQLPPSGVLGLIRAAGGLAGAAWAPAYALLLVADPAPPIAHRRTPLAAGALALLGALGGLALLAGVLDVLGLPLRPLLVGPLISLGLVAAAVWLVRHPAFLESARSRRRSQRRLLRHRRGAAVGVAAAVAVLLALPSVVLRFVPLVPVSAPYSSLAFGDGLARLTGPLSVPDGNLGILAVHRARGADGLPEHLEVRVDGRLVASPPLSEPVPALGDDDPGSREADREAPLLEQRAAVSVLVPIGSCLHRVEVRSPDGPRIALYAARQPIPEGVTCVRI